jgi:hypothetical protein
MYCCRGYCIDLLKQLALKKNFTASLALSPDGQFGSFVSKNGTSTMQDALISYLISISYKNMRFATVHNIFYSSQEGVDGIDW